MVLTLIILTLRALARDPRKEIAKPPVCGNVLSNSTLLSRKHALPVVREHEHGSVKCLTEFATASLSQLELEVAQV